MTIFKCFLLSKVSSQHILMYVLLPALPACSSVSRQKVSQALLDPVVIVSHTPASAHRSAQRAVVP
jgi:hypothetical protein